MNIINKIKNSIIISVQAMPNEPLYKEDCMNAMIQSVLKGGAKALRLAGARDIKNAKKFSEKFSFLRATFWRKFKKLTICDIYNFFPFLEIPKKKFIEL